LVVIRPDTMVPSEHLKLEEGCPVKLAFKTPTGEFNICRLDLNRPGLQELRSIRIMLEGCSEYVQEGVRALSSVSLDGLRPRARGQFIKLREKLVGKAAEYDQGFDDLLRDFARSPLRKADPDRRERTKARKARLEELLNPPDSL
jgi:hypothetical protein